MSGHHGRRGKLLISGRGSPLSTHRSPSTKGIWHATSKKCYSHSRQLRKVWELMPMRTAMGIDPQLFPSREARRRRCDQQLLTSFVFVFPFNLYIHWHRANHVIINPLKVHKSSNQLPTFHRHTNFTGMCASCCSGEHDFCQWLY